MPAFRQAMPAIQLKPVRPSKVRPQLIDIPGTQHQLVQQILDSAERLEKGREYAWDDMALITFRDRVDTGILTELLRRQIPVTIQGPIDSAKLNNVNRVLTIVSLLVRPWDRWSLVDTIIGERDDFAGRRWSDLEASIAKKSRERGIPPLEACALLLQEGALTSEWTRFVVERIVSTWRHLDEQLESNAGDIAEFLQLAWKLVRGAGQGYPATKVASPMQQLLESAQAQVGPPLLLETVRESLLPLLAVWDMADNHGVPRRKGLTLSTVEAATGLQWRCVWLIDSSDHLIPGLHTPEKIHEFSHQQRRFYVATTRACDRLYYCNARGGGRGFEPRPTRFLAALEGQLEHLGP